MKFRYLYRILLLSAISIIASASVSSAALSVDYLYNLSNFNGIVPSNWVNLFVDKSQNEVYVCNDSTDVTIFNSTGMEVYRFGEDVHFGHQIMSGAVEENGDILLLTLGGLENDEYNLVRCDYRGDFKSMIPWKGMPARYAHFGPNRMIYMNGKIYLISLPGMQVVELDKDGTYLDSYDIASILGLNGEEVGDSGLFGFNMDKNGNMYFTIATRFKAYKLTPDRKLLSWGEPGGAPGKFNVVSGIAVDKNGNIYVADTLKCTVEVFDKDLKWVTDFGGRGYRGGLLVAPRAVVIDGDNKIYVTQSRSMGVSVFKITE
jgi:NHL repeat